MEIKTRLLRQPWLTALWTLALAAAFGLLLTGAGLLRAAWLTQSQLEQQYTTLALAVPDDRTITSGAAATAKTNNNAYPFSLDETQWLESLPQVSMVEQRRATAAYSPAFRPLLSLEQVKMDQTSDRPYCSVLLTGVLGQYMEEQSSRTEIPGYTTAQGTQVPDLILYIETYELQLEAVLQAHPGLQIRDTLLVTFSYYDQTDKQPPQPGQRCILYGSFSQTDIYNLAEANLVAHLGIEQQDQEEILPSLHVGDTMAYSLHLLPDGTEAVYGPADRQPMPSWEVLDTSADEFLARPENALWNSVMEENEITLHSAPVLGTNRLESVYSFHQQQAVLVEGRSFTPEEYEQGAKVCILSQPMAQSSGIQVGDTISLSQYALTDPPEIGLSGENLSLYPGYPTMTSQSGYASNPTVTAFCSQYGFTSQDTFEVVGLYRTDEMWQDSAYSFTSNTIFVPQKAQTSAGSQSTGGIYYGLVLHNGQGAAFLEQVAQAGMEGRLIVLDQGYEAASSSIRTIATSAGRLAAIAVAGWAVVLALYLVLWQGRQKRQLGVMRSLGASRRRARRYLLGSGLAPAALGALLGWGASVALAGQVDRLLLQTAAGLEQTSHSAGTAQLPLLAQSGSAGWMALAALAALALAGLALWAQAALLAGKKPRDLMR